MPRNQSSSQATIAKVTAIEESVNFVSNFSSLNYVAPVKSPAKTGLIAINPPATIPTGSKYIFFIDQKLWISDFKLKIFAVAIFTMINNAKRIKAELSPAGVLKS